MMKPFIEGRTIREGVRTFYNGKYQVIIYHEIDGYGKPVIHLSLRREDRKAIFDWRDVQLIKKYLLGPEEEMVQLFPAESRHVDMANQYHFYCYTSEKFSFGFNCRSITENIQVRIPGGQNSVQRSFAPEHRPDDLAECESRAIKMLNAKVVAL